MNWHVEDGNRVFGARYYTVQPVSSEWERRHTDWLDWINWCKEAFGTEGDVFECRTIERWYANNSRLWFRNEEDLAAFLLRWS